MKYLTILLALSFTSCAWLESHKAQLGATGSWLAKKAALLAIQTVVNAATSPQDASDKGDYLDSLAQGFRSVDKSTLVSADDFRDLANVWAPTGAQHWAVLGGQIANVVLANGGPSDQRLEAVAIGLQDAAQEARAEATALKGP